MKIKKYSSQVSRKILTGMIVHDGILQSIYDHLEGERQPFNQRWLDLVARWCLDYFQHYGKAPRQAITDKFSAYAERSKGDEENIQLVESFLENLGREYKTIKSELNEHYILDIACHTFNQVKLQRMAEEIQDAIDDGDVERAFKARDEFQKVEHEDKWRFENPFSKQCIIETFRDLEKEEQLIQFRSEDLHRFLSPHMKRGDFVSFVGPEKRGKSYFLQEIAYLALRSKRRVLYYAFGDMSKREIMRRLYIRAARRPWREQEFALPEEFSFTDGKLDELFVKESKIYPALTRKDVWEARNKLIQVMACKEVNLKLHVDVAFSISATNVSEHILKLVQREGWMPDVVVLDYADLLLPERGSSKDEFRHRVNATWAILRNVALSNHCLLVTATQSASTGYGKKWVLTKDDFSEDKRKNAHVTGMIGINQTDKEKQIGVYRLNWIVLRDGHWTEKQVVWTAGNLALSNPAMISAFSNGK